MKIGYYGDGEWAHEALRSLISLPACRIAFIVARSDNPDPVLRDYAGKLDIPFFAPENVNAPSFLDEVRNLNPDLNISMSYNQILRREAIDLAPKGFINCHAGALPFYRGRNILNWALINGEDRFGVTVHYVNEGIDTGDIITQRFGVITPQDTYATLLDKAVDLCAEAVTDAVRSIRSGSVSTTAQKDIHPVGFYCSARQEGDEWIDWTWTTERIHNLVRALTRPGPGARTLLEGDNSIVILQSELIPKAPSYIDRPGTVVGRDDGSMSIKTGDTSLRVTKIGTWDNGVTDVRKPDFRIGTRFGLNVHDCLSRALDRIEVLERRLDDIQNS